MQRMGKSRESHCIHNGVFIFSNGNVHHTMSSHHPPQDFSALISRRSSEDHISFAAPFPDSSNLELRGSSASAVLLIGPESKWRVDANIAAVAKP